VGGQQHSPAALPPAKTQYPLFRRLVGPQDRCGRVRKTWPPPAFDPRTVQPVASRYTDWAVLVHRYLSKCSEIVIEWQSVLVIKVVWWYTWTDYKTNTQIAKELKITPILDKLMEYKRSWIQHVNRMPRNRLPRVMKHYCPKVRRNHGRPLKRLMDTWDRDGSTSGPTPWHTHTHTHIYI